MAKIPASRGTEFYLKLAKRDGETVMLNIETKNGLELEKATK